MNLHIEQVNEQNIPEILLLKVAKGQETFIETTQQCLEEMKQTPQFRSVGLYDGNILVGSYVD